MGSETGLDLLPEWSCGILIEADEDYFLDHYGTCELDDKCTCLRDGWKGQMCFHWQSFGARSLEDLMKHARGIKDHK